MSKVSVYHNLRKILNDANILNQKLRKVNFDWEVSVKEFDDYYAQVLKSECRIQTEIFLSEGVFHSLVSFRYQTISTTR